MSAWKPFPYDSEPFTYEGDELAEAWDSLHAGDCEPWPDEGRIQAILEAHPDAAPGELGVKALLHVCGRGTLRCREKRRREPALLLQSAGRGGGRREEWVESHDRSDEVA